MEKFFFILSWMFQGSSYLSPYVYGKLHRLHHAYADTEQDPHSPKYDETLWKMMLKTKDIYTKITHDQYPVDEKYSKNLPSWYKFDRFADGWISRLFWGISYIIVYAWLVDYWWLWLLLPIQLMFSPVHGAIINWFAHKYGYRSYEMEDTSTNLLPLDIIMWGESYHNNHHKYSADPNFGKKWFEIDPAYIMIRIFNALGIIKLKRT